LQQNTQSKTVATQAKAASSSFKQYREKDGLFYFKLVSAQGQVLLQSIGFAAPRDAGQLIARMTKEGSNCFDQARPYFSKISVSEEERVKNELDKLALDD